MFRAGTKLPGLNLAARGLAARGLAARGLAARGLAARGLAPGGTGTYQADQQAGAQVLRTDRQGAVEVRIEDGTLCVRTWR